MSLKKTTNFLSVFLRRYIFELLELWTHNQTTLCSVLSNETAETEHELSVQVNLFFLAYHQTRNRRTTVSGFLSQSLPTRCQGNCSHVCFQRSLGRRMQYWVEGRLFDKTCSEKHNLLCGMQFNKTTKDHVRFCNNCLKTPIITIV